MGIYCIIIANFPLDIMGSLCVISNQLSVFQVFLQKNIFAINLLIFLFIFLIRINRMHNWMLILFINLTFSFNVLKFRKTHAVKSWWFGVFRSWGSSIKLSRNRGCGTHWSLIFYRLILNFFVFAFWHHSKKRRHCRIFI